MENQMTLADSGKSISEKLLNSIYLLDILFDVIGSEAKTGTIISVIQNNITSAFRELEDCRRIIGSD